jgi:KUP system potassium uptake protein
MSLHLSTPAHRFFGLNYDAGVSKELIPVEFSHDSVRVALPELEINEPLQPQVAVAAADRSA